MAPRQRNRAASVDSDGEILADWFTVETEDGVGIGGVDGQFDWNDQQSAETAVVRFAAEISKPLSVVRYSREVLGTYAAVTKIEKI